MSQRADGFPGAPPTSGPVPEDFYVQTCRAPPTRLSAATAFMRVQGGSPLSQSPICGPAAAGSAFQGLANISTSLPFNARVPGALHSPTQTASSSIPHASMEPYNPRQWGQGRQVSGSQMVFGKAGSAALSTRDATGMEEMMPEAPPPYVPRASGNSQQYVRGSPLLETASFTASPIARATSSSTPPGAPMPPAFPPPPAQPSRHRERSASGLAGTRAFLSGLRGKQPANAVVPTSDVVHVLDTADPRPPAARRAASTGQIQASSSLLFTARPVSSQRSSPGEQRIVLPPPPSGPPPIGGRSQSLHRYPLSSSAMYSYNEYDSQHRRRAAAISGLGSIPPTPADWVEGADTQRLQSKSNLPITQGQVAKRSESLHQPLRVVTGTHLDTSIARRPAQRGVSGDGIRERRSRSRKAREGNGNEILSPESDDSRPSDLLFSPSSSSISRRREHMRMMSGHADPPAKQSSIMQPTVNPASMLTPPYTPAGRPGGTSSAESRTLLAHGSTCTNHPITYAQTSPNEHSAPQAPQSPARPTSAGRPKSSVALNSFALQALERHRIFIEKEAAATSDEECLELFTNFIVNESRLRRDRYPTAYHAMAGDIVDLARDLWRSYTNTNKRAVTPSTSMSSLDPTIPSWASDGQKSVHDGSSSFGEFTPATDVGSVGDIGAEGLDRSESRQWIEAFKPSLSPIQSVAQSNLQDETSSRGRASSRWWEQSNSGSGSGSIGRPDRFEKSSRETKYMGVRACELQESAEPSPIPSKHTVTPGATVHSFPKVDEYPPAKTGWHEDTASNTPLATPARIRECAGPAPGLDLLDVSRLVTLPPPYPRHHPAVNNSHPMLATLRKDHRMLLDHQDIQAVKDAFLDQDFATRQEQKEGTRQRQARFHSSIQAKVNDRSISFADAAQAETEFETEEAARGKANARAVFDVYEANVAQPLNTLLTENIAKGTSAIGQLRTELSFGNQASDPNQAQEEGDEKPERLEKLTLLKWLFEAGEQLQKELFDLHAQRSEKYAEVILAPYRILHAQAKIDEATAFFTKDSNERQTAFLKECLKRIEELQQVMERHVSRGVEDQLSAFWDIAPNLMKVITRVPTDVTGFEIQIPAQEYEENPSYTEFPMQYLYGLLSHAEKSTYQFIESQTNLLCLLHEVRTAASKSRLRLLEMQRLAAEPADARTQSETLQARQEAEDMLTEDLKEKVGEVERQWKEALGDGLEGCKERVRGWLEISGGWEDGLEG